MAIGRAARLGRAALAAVAIGTVFVGVGPAAGLGPRHQQVRSATSAGLGITAFQEDGDPNSLITRSAKALSTVGVDGVDISANGSRVGVPGAVARRSLAVAHRDHLRAELLVGNFDDGIEDFSEAYAHRLLDSAAHMQVVAGALADSVAAQGWDGVSVDLESLLPRDRAGLVTFLRYLQSDLSAGKTLSVCITNFTTPSQYRANGYDLAGIAKQVNQVVLMSYDQHGSWENTPGPVGALRWQRAGLKVMLRSVPAAKIDLGEAGYGYAWRPHSNYQISDAKARRLVAADHATARWDAPAGEWTARLSDGSTLWWADARSLRLRVTIARNHHLHGLAVWDLGLSDPIG